MPEKEFQNLAKKHLTAILPAIGASNLHVPEDVNNTWGELRSFLEPSVEMLTSPEESLEVYNLLNDVGIVGHLVQIMLNCPPDMTLQLGNESTSSSDSLKDLTWFQALETLAAFIKVADEINKDWAYPGECDVDPIDWSGLEVDWLRSLHASPLFEATKEAEYIERFAEYRTQVVTILYFFVDEVELPPTYESGRRDSSRLRQIGPLSVLIRTTCITESEVLWNKTISSIVDQCAETLFRSVTFLITIEGLGAAEMLMLYDHTLEQLVDTSLRALSLQQGSLHQTQEYELLACLIDLAGENHRSVGEAIIAGRLLVLSAQEFRQMRAKYDVNVCGEISQEALDAQEFHDWCLKCPTLWASVLRLGQRQKRPELVNDVVEGKLLYLAEWLACVLPKDQKGDQEMHASIRKSISPFALEFGRLIVSDGCKPETAAAAFAQLRTIRNRSTMTYASKLSQKVWNQWAMTEAILARKAGIKYVPTNSSDTPATCRGPLCEANQIPKLMCGRCGTPYCSASCQKNDWPEHKTYCRSRK
ncbi:hypothetical protein DL93DRAFT_2072350 [Clavulina sp. PMI_390]|nr:hypothetical protein DL93DRAFT_2072350 [Clavulina sp. PMI_390]